MASAMLPGSSSHSYEDVIPRSYLKTSGIVRVKLQKAKNLQAKKNDGSSDPVAILRLGGGHAICRHTEPGGHTSHNPLEESRHAKTVPTYEPQHWSKVIQKNRDPIWEEWFDFEVLDLEAIHSLTIHLQNGRGSKTKEGDLGYAEIKLSEYLDRCPDHLPPPSSDAEQLYPELTFNFENRDLTHPPARPGESTQAGKGYIGQVWLSVSILPKELMNQGPMALAAARQALARALYDPKGRSGGGGGRLGIEFDGAADDAVAVEQSWSVRHSDQQVYRRNYQCLNAVASVLVTHPTITCEVHCRTDDVEKAPERLARMLGRDPVRGAYECMQHLAERRAAACVQMLISLGVDARRIYATTKPLAHEGGGVDFNLQLEPPPALQEGGVGGAGGAEHDLPQSAAAQLAAQQAKAMGASALGAMAKNAAAADAQLAAQQQFQQQQAPVPPGTIGVTLSQLRLNDGVLRDGRCARCGSRSICSAWSGRGTCARRGS